MEKIAALDFGGSDRFERIASLGLNHMHPGGVGATRRLLQEAALKPGERILDVGCGVGETTCLLTRRYGVEATGLDRSESMVARARARARRQGSSATFRTGDAHALDFADERFDAVIAESVTLFLDCERALPEFNRVLRKGGRMADIVMTCSEPVPPEVLDRMAELEGVRMYPKLESEWRDLYDRAGFRLRYAEFHPTLADSSGLRSFLESNGWGAFPAVARLIGRFLFDPPTRRYFQEVSSYWKQHEGRFGYGLLVAERP